MAIGEAISGGSHQQQPSERQSKPSAAGAISSSHQRGNQSHQRREPSAAAIRGAIKAISGGSHQQQPSERQSKPSAAGAISSSHQRGNQSHQRREPSAAAIRDAIQRNPSHTPSASNPQGSPQRRSQTQVCTPRPASATFQREGAESAVPSSHSAAGVRASPQA
jgi:hypothetical protein